MLKLASYEDYSFISDTKDRARVQRLEAAFMVVGAARRGEKITLMREQAANLGEAYKTFERKFYAWLDRQKKQQPGTRAVAAIADLRKVKDLVRPASLAFEVFKKDFAVHNYESLKSAHAHFIAAFNNYQLLGYGLDPRKIWKEEHRYQAVPEYLGSYVPHGWSYENFDAKWKRDPSRLATLAWTRQGMLAASKFVKSVIRSRFDEATGRQLPAGAVIQCDDAWENLGVIVKGETGVLRPMAFHIYDVGTGFHFDPWFKARHWETNSDGERVKRSNLTEREFRMVLGAHFVNHGMNRNGCLVIQEHATTAIRPDVQRQIANIPGFTGMIRFAASGAVNKTAYAGMFLGSVGGNPQYKSLVEGGHRVMQMQIANLPGNMGRDAAHRHESWAALEKYTEKMLVKMEELELPEEVRAMIKLPVMRFEEFGRCYGELNDRVMDQTNHRMEGWVKYYAEEFQVPGDREGRWFPLKEFDKLSPGVQELVIANNLFRSRKMSRREAYASWAAEMVKIPVDEAYQFFDWEKDAKELTVTPRRTIELSDKDYYPNGKVVFDAILTGRDGGRRELCPGEKVKVYINPLIDYGNRIWVASMEDEFLGTCRKTQMSAFWGDEAGIKRAAGLKLADQARMLEDTRKLHASDSARLVLERAQNELILQAAEREGVTPRRRRVTAEAEEREQAEAGAMLAQLAKI